MKAKLPVLFVLVLLAGCVSAGRQIPSRLPASRQPPAPDTKSPRNSVPVIQVFVALCDNVHQGIVPISASLGNGDDPARNLYWGAAFGVKTFFGKSKEWQLVSTQPGPDAGRFIIERVVFKRRDREAFLVAGAYRGREIRRATENFLQAAAGVPGETLTASINGKEYTLHLGGSATLIAYTGHNGLMDFQISSPPQKRDDEDRDAIILACASKSYFADVLRGTGARPLLWTTNLMAPEAYILAAALEGWLRKETGEQIRLRAAKAYNQYQHCGEHGANRLFASGW